MIEHAASDDLPALAALMAGSPLLQRYGISLDLAAAALDDALAHRDTLLVAREPRPIGVAWLIHTRAFARCSYLCLLLVAEGHQQVGLGSALLAAGESAARVWSPHLYLFVTTDNLGTRRFYERHGYRHVGDLPGVTAPGRDEALHYKML